MPTQDVDVEKTSLELPGELPAPSTSICLTRAQLIEACAAAQRALPIAKRNHRKFLEYTRGIRYFGAWYVLRFGTAFIGPMHSRLFYQFVRDHVSIEEKAEDELFADFRYATAMNYAMPLEVEQRLIAEGFKRKRGPYSQQGLAILLCALRHAWSRSEGESKNGRSYVLGKELATRRLTAAARRAETRNGTLQKVRSEQISPLVHARLVQTCGTDPIGLRDRALLWFGWLGPGMSPADIVRARIEQLTVVSPSHVMLCLSGNPDRQISLGVEREFIDDAAKAIVSWLEYLARIGIRTGTLFRVFDSRRRTLSGMEPDVVTRIVKARATKAGLDRTCIRGSGLWSRKLRV